MQTLYEILGQTLNNRTVDFTNRTAELLEGNHILFRLRVTDLRPDATMTVSMDVTFPSGRTKHFDLFINEAGSYQRGGWSGEERSGTISASGTITVTGRTTFDAYVVTFDKGEDVPEWS